LKGPAFELEGGDMAEFIRGKMEIAGLVGPLWFIGWLFTVGYAELPFFKAFIALAFWPYFLGSTLA